VGGIGRHADEDPMTAWRVAGARRLERSGDNDRADAARCRERRIDAEVRVRLVPASASNAIDDRGANRVRAGFHRNPEASDVRRLQLLAVERDIDLRPAAATRTGAGEAEFVLGVERKGVTYEQPASRAERQPFDVFVLNESARS